jgi:putative radical SAM enzyme (TIGR03279 family)
MVTTVLLLGERHFSNSPRAAQPNPAPINPPMYSEIFETLYPINLLKKERGVAVTAVDPFGIGDRVGLEPGHRIMTANGQEVRDFLDFQFLTGSEDRVSLEFSTGSGEPRRIEVEIGEGEIWGLDFEYFSPRQCANDCIFCFCNQNPPGSRDSLFFKDEDIRLSFLHGNYTTMSSISKMELDRIVEQRLSPQYVSVHATDPEVRKYLLGRKRPDRIIDKLRYLSGQGIELHAQIVLCPGINDGEVLRKTVDDLAELYPGLRSIAVVPVVVTRLHNYRNLITLVSDEYSRGLIQRVSRWQRDFRKKFGVTFVFLADEFYLRAGKPVPGPEHYGDYPQIEDGVGMVRRFIVDARKAAAGEEKAGRTANPRQVFGTIATGKLFFPVLEPLVKGMNERLGTRLKTVAVENTFFGGEVTVAGLLAGKDLLRARDSFEGNFVVVPEQACLKAGQIFLDDLSVGDVQNGLGLRVVSSGLSLAETMDKCWQFGAESPNQ